MQLSVVIPAYNEEFRLGPTLEATISYLEKNIDTYEVLVVDDGSKDKTVEIAQKYKTKGVRCISNPKNMGKGFSVKLGMVNARYDPILFMDSDLSTPMEETKKLLDALQEGYDVAIGSRNVEGANIIIKQPKYRQLLGKTFPVLVQTLVLPDFLDTQCGFKMFKRESVRKIFPRQTLQRFAFDVEILFIAKKLNLKVKEIAVTWVGKEGSKVSPIKDSISMFREVLKIKYNDAKGEYK